MRLAPEIQSTPVVPVAQDKGPTSRVRVPGQLGTTEVWGAVLQAAFVWDRFVVVLLTDDDDYEDVVHIHLLDATGRLLDSAMVGAPYTTGIFSGLQITGANQFCFDFYENCRWHITLFAKPRLRLPWPEAIGVSRRLWLRRHFGIRREERALPAQ